MNRLLFFVAMLFPLAAVARRANDAAAWRKLLSAQCHSTLMQHPELAKQVSGPEFIDWFFHNGFPPDTKRNFYLARMIRIDSMGADTAFIYFATLRGSYPISFVKVRPAELNGLHTAALRPEEIRSRFIEEVIPKAHSQRVEKSSYHSGYSRGTFSYEFDAPSQTILISYRWIVRQDFATKVNHIYSAIFDVSTRNFHGAKTIRVNKKQAAEIKQRVQRQKLFGRTKPVSYLCTPLDGMAA